MNEEEVTITKEIEEIAVSEAEIELAEAEEPLKRKKRKKYQVVKVLQMAHGNALLEWETDGLVDRCYLPQALMEHAEVGKHVSVDEEDLAMGAPFGDDLRPYLAAQPPTPERLQDTLRRRGVWRRRDILQQSSVVRSALQALYNLDVVRIQGRVKEAMAYDGGA